MALAALAAVAAFADWYRAASPDALATATYVGRQACIECHQQEHDLWTGSHHDWAMDRATDQTVLGDFDNAVFERLGVTTRFFRDGDRFMVNTEGPDGDYADFEVKYTFGVEPLQQYMVELRTGEDADGRVQVLRVSWDTRKKRWFYVPPPDATEERILPGDPTHWTGIAQNWNTTCAVCHSTNLQKNYDLATDSYDTTWSEIDVSCEECHGPASLHVELASANSLFWDRRHGYGLAKLKSADPTAQIETCAKCHSRRSDVHPDFRPGSPLLDSYEPTLLHGGLYHADGQILDEVYVYGSFVQSKMYAKGIRCSECHNPHSLKLEAPGNLMCAKCHEPTRYDTVAHHHHPDPQPGVASVGSQCVECHMPSTTYMVVDPRRDHSLRVPRPELTVSLGTPNACNNCHTGDQEDAEWAAAKVAQWRKSKVVDPLSTGAWTDAAFWTPAIEAGRQGLPAGEQQLIKLARTRTVPTIVRATAVELLQQYPSADATQAITKALDSTEPLVRLAATRSIPATSTNELVALLGEHLTDPSRVVRISAARRLAGLPPELFSASQLKARNEGVLAYRQRQALSADHADAHLNLASLAKQIGDTGGAITALRDAMRLEPYRSTVRYELALLLERRRGDPEEIRRLREEEARLLARDAEMLPDNPEVCYRLGLTQYKLADLPAAETALIEACRRAPDRYNYQLALALMQEQLYVANPQEAIFSRTVATLETLNRLAPESQEPALVLKRLMTARQAAQKRAAASP